MIEHSIYGLLRLLIISLRFLRIVVCKFRYKALTMTNDNLKTLNDYAKGQLGVLKVALQTQDEALIKYQLSKLKVASELSELCSLVEKGANAQALAMIDDLLAFKVSEKCEFDDEYFARLVKWADDNKIAADNFPREKERLVKLKELDLLSGCDLKSLPDEFANLQSLEKLNLVCNKFQEFPKALCKLKNLKELILWNCDLEYLPNEFANLQNLEELILARNKFQEFPKALCKLKNLKELNLWNCDLEYLPDEFVNLQNLKKLNLGGNKFKEFPKVVDIFTKLKSLKELNLYECGLNSLPDEFVNLQSLEKLNLWGNEFKEFPKVINKLKNLKECDIKEADFQAKEN